MRNTIIKAVISICIFMWPGVSAQADPLGSWNHNFNPALLGVRNRPHLELGISADAMLTNSALGLDEIFTEEVVIDLNKIADDLAGGSVLVNSDLGMETHLVLSLLGIDIGVYAGTDGVVSLGIPGEFVRLLADGNSLNGTSRGSEDVYGRLFATAGVFAGFRLKNFQFGAKIGLFGPLFCTAPGSSFGYSLATSQAGGQISGSAFLDVPFYSAIDFNEPDVSRLIEGLNGVNLAVGMVKVRKNKAMWGFNISGITLKPAAAGFRSVLSSYASIDIDNIAGNADSDDGSWIIDDLKDVELETSEGAYEVSMPLQVGGFYRLSGFPGFIDWIAHAELTFDDEMQLRAGLSAQGSISALSWLSLGLEYNRIFWNAELGLRANLRFFELGIEVGAASPELKHLLNINGIYGRVFVGMGF